MIPLRHYPTIDSTNLESHRLFASGERGPLFLLADEQTTGRGRLDRNWASLRGNCFSTLILPLPMERHPGASRDIYEPEIPAFAETTAGVGGLALAKVPQISFVTALAVADVVSKNTASRPQLKWPNDVLVRGAKIAGILCEVLSTSPLTIAVGCGINVAHAPTGLAYPATCIAAEGGMVDRDAVFHSYGEALRHWLAIWNYGTGFPAIRTAWCALAIGLGEAAVMTTGTQQLTGTFEGITEQGAVMLKPLHGPPHILHAGDLHIPALARLRNENT